jgi:hypothetical protein
LWEGLTAPHRENVIKCNRHLLWNNAHKAEWIRILKLEISGFLESRFIENGCKRIRKEGLHVTIKASRIPQVRKVLHCTSIR